jgi:hypothetical protein
MAFHWANQPVVTTITDSDDTETVTAASATKTVSTDYYSFDVPSAMRVRTSTDVSHPGLIHTLIFDGTSEGRQVGITSSTLPASGISGVADYNMRKMLTSKYEPYASTDVPTGGEAFRNVEDGELTLFMVHGGRYVSVSVSGVSSGNRLEDLLRKISSTWRWEQP